HPVQRPRHGRVRRGLRGVGTHRRPDRHHAVADREAVPGIQHARIVRARVRPDPGGHIDADHQELARTQGPIASAGLGAESDYWSVAMSIVIKDISKSFGSFRAVDHVSLEVPTGSLLALLGPSGSGKTTLLRIIAGLEVADEGAVFHQDEEITHYSAR